MSKDVIEILVSFLVGGGLTGLIGKVGIPEYIKYRREKYEARIAEYKQEIKLLQAKCIEHDKEKQLVKEKYRLLEMQFKTQTNDVATTIHVIENLITNSPDVKKILDLIKVKLNVNVTPAKT